MNINKWLVAIAVGLATLVSQAAEETAVKTSDVPEVVRDQVMNGMAKGAPTKFFKVAATPPEGKWRAEYAKDGKSHGLLIHTRDKVTDGKTNTIIVRYETLKKIEK